jgi:hypothetical protein
MLCCCTVAALAFSSRLGRVANSIVSYVIGNNSNISSAYRRLSLNLISVSRSLSFRSLIEKYKIAIITNVVHQRAGHPTEWASKPHQSAFATTTRNVATTQSSQNLY